MSFIALTGKLKNGGTSLMLCVLRSSSPDLDVPQVSIHESAAPRCDGEVIPPCDAELVVRLANGRIDSLSTLYERHSGLLLALALRILHNRHDAEEVVQEVFLYAWRRADSYDPARSSVSSWLVIITRSRSLDRLRSCRRAESIRSEIQQNDPAPPVLPSEGFDQVLSGERSARVRQAVAQLPPPQRQVLEFSYYRGWTQKEVAEEIGIPIGTVKTRTFLALKKLRRALDGERSHLVG